MSENLSVLTKKQLHQKCEDLGIIKYKSKNKNDLIELIQKNLKLIHSKEVKEVKEIKEIKEVKKVKEVKEIKEIKEVKEVKEIKEVKDMKDLYTIDVLLECYYVHKNYVSKRKEILNGLNISFRLPAIPEDISENLIKFMIHKYGDTSSNWSCKTGDLVSHIEGKQECKCFTSDGPISFTPSSDWDIIYFLDARNWIHDNFILYRVNLQKKSDEWSNLPISKTQSFKDQCLQGRRPRINWNALKPHIEKYSQIIFDGNLKLFLKKKTIS